MGLSRWKQLVVMSSSVASWQKGSLCERQKVLVQAEQAAGTRLARWVSRLSSSGKSGAERRLDSGFSERGMIVLFLKQVHLQKVWGA